MKMLFIGGTGLISSASARLAIALGIDLLLLNHGNHADIPAGATNIIVDIRDQDATARALVGHQFDVVVGWIAYTPD
jgi:nucleoside-diphosphate-sugar epimerase